MEYTGLKLLGLSALFTLGGGCIPDDYQGPDEVITNAFVENLLNTTEDLNALVKAYHPMNDQSCVVYIEDIVESTKDKKRCVLYRAFTSTRGKDGGDSSPDAESAQLKTCVDLEL
jgi:hypothetical protein